MSKENVQSLKSAQKVEYVPIQICHNGGKKTYYYANFECAQRTLIKGDPKSLSRKKKFLLKICSYLAVLDDIFTKAINTY